MLPRWAVRVQRRTGFLNAERPIAPRRRVTSLAGGASAGCRSLLAEPARAAARDDPSDRGSPRRAPQQPGELVGRGRAREEKALAEPAAEPPQPMELLGGLDSSADDLDVERSSKGDRSGNDRGVLALRAQAVDKRAIDLQGTDREPSKIAE